MSEEKTFRDRIIEYRARHNMSQEDFAIECKVCLMTVNAIENGKRNPTKLTKAKIEYVLQKGE